MPGALFLLALLSQNNLRHSDDPLPVRIVVVHPDGSGAPGIHLLIQNLAALRREPERWSATTDDAGRAQLTVPVQQVRVEVADPTFAPSAEDVTLWPQREQPTRLLLLPPSSISARVVDSEGKALVGAHVEGVPHFREDGLSANAGPDGRVAFPRLDPGLYKLTAELEGYASVERNVAVMPGERREDILIRMEREATLRLRLSFMGKPCSVGNLWISTPGREVHVQLNDGEAKARALPPGRLQIRAQSNCKLVQYMNVEWGGLKAAAAVDVAAGGVAALTLPLEVSNLRARITGQVVDTRGRGVEGAVEALCNDVRQETRTTATGHFELRDLPAGRCRVHATSQSVIPFRKPPLDWAEVEVESPGDVRPVLPSGSLTVQAGAARIASGRAYLELAGGPSTWYVDLPAHFPHLPPGRYHVSVWTRAGSAETDVTLAPNASVRVDLAPAPRGARLRGRVVDGSTDKPLEGVTVWAPEWGPHFLPAWNRIEAARTDASGRFELQELESGASFVALVADGFLPRFLPQDIRGHIDLGRVALRRGFWRRERTLEEGFSLDPTTLRIHILDPEGPASRAGLKEGDLLVEMDGIPTRGISLNLLDQVQASGDGPTSLLQVRRGAQLLAIRLPR